MLIHVWGECRGNSILGRDPDTSILSRNGKSSAAGRRRVFEQWNADMAEAVSAIGQAAFPPALERALARLAPFEMMNGFGYAAQGRAFDLYNDRIVGDRAIIVDRYLAGSYILDPFYDALRRPERPALLVMRELAPDRFNETEYFRRHYQTTGIVDEIGFVLKLQHADAVLSLSRMGAVPGFSAGEIAALAAAAPLVCAVAERHWHARCDPDGAEGQAAAAISHPSLSKRELEIVTLILKGHSSYSIAATLGLSPNTVKVHRRQAYAKLNISSQVELFHLFLS